MSRHPHAPSNVSAHSDPAASHGKQGSFAAGRAAGGVARDVRIVGAAEDIVGRLKGEEGDGDVGLDERHGAGVLEQPHDRGIVGGGFVDPFGVADAGVVTLDVDGVFEGHGYTCQWTCGIDKLLVPCLSPRTGKCKPTV